MSWLSLPRRTPWRSLLALLLALLAALPAGLSPAAHAQEAPTLRVVHRVTSTFADNALHIHLTAEFWAGSRRYDVDELAQLAPHFQFETAATRGHTVLLALPAGTLPFISEQSGNATLVAMRTPEMAAAAVDQLPSVAELLGYPVWLRDQYVARLRLRPVRFDAGSSELVLTPDLTLRIRIIGQWPKLEPARFDPHWEPLYRQIVLNYEDGRVWRQMPDAPATALPAPRPASDWRVRIGVSAAGLHQLRHEDLAGLGLDLAGVDPRLLQLYRQAQPAAMWVEGEEDGSFDPGDRLIFYAPPWFARDTVEDAFWLVLGAEPGIRVTLLPAGQAEHLLPAYADTVRREEQLLYYPDLPLQGAVDHWYWASVRPGRSAAAMRTVNFQLYPVTWGPINATLQLRVLGKDQGQAMVRVRINGFQAGAFGIADKQGVEFRAAFPHFLLRSGANQAEIEVERVGEVSNTIVLDWIEIEYVRQFQATDGRLRFDVDWPGAWRLHLLGFETLPYVWDVSDPAQPRMATGLQQLDPQEENPVTAFVSASATTPTYEAASEQGLRHPSRLTWAPAPTPDLRSPDMQADYIIISPAAFLPAANRLAAYRAGQGLTTLVAPLDQIYESFAGGVAGPQALHDFSLFALANWRSPAPAYVLLLGDAHYDPKQYITAEPVHLPAFLRSADPWIGEVAEENYFAALAGDDPAPDILLGRLPVQSLAQAEMLVDKLIAYEQVAPDAAWLDRVLLATDDPDNAGNFHALADEMARLAGRALTVEKFYLAGNYATAAGLRAGLLASWNQGAFLVNYIGHGHPSAWAGEQILRVSDVAGLQNQGRPAVVLAMSSLNGIYYWPGGPSLLEALLLLPEGRGAVGYVASTGFGISGGNALVNEGFLDAVVNDGEVMLGKAVLRGKMHLYTQGYSYTEFLTRLYTLIGDPATRLPAPAWPQTFYLPLVAR